MLQFMRLQSQIQLSDSHISHLEFINISATFSLRADRGHKDIR